jgi:hypothetical protein
LIAVAVAKPQQKNGKQKQKQNTRNGQIFFGEYLKFIFKMHCLFPPSNTSLPHYITNILVLQAHIHANLHAKRA